MSDLPTAVAAIRQALERGPTPGPWTWGEYRGHCIDWVRTEHPDWQVANTQASFVADTEFTPPEVAQTGNAHGQEGLPQRWPANAAYIAACHPSALRLILDALEKAEKTLRLAGYTDEGGELWKPPLGPSATPLLDALEEREAQVARQAKLIQAAEQQLVQLRATLAASCDEEREQMWEATTGGGCARAIAAEAQLAQARELLELALPCVEQHSNMRGGHADRIRTFLYAKEQT